ncbi:MAG: mercury transporter [Deltaproteobacteria bacterium]|nr:MAG: mercury transporter [Deltaproteobacteria bacterium]
MGCAHCVMKVTKAIESIAGIRDVKVDLKSGEATFDKPNTVNMEDIFKAIEKA